MRIEEKSKCLWSLSTEENEDVSKNKNLYQNMTDKLKQIPYDNSMKICICDQPNGVKCVW